MTGHRPNPRWWGLAIKLPLTIAVIVFAVALAVGAIAVVREVDTARAGLEERAQQLVRLVALQNVENVKRRDYWEMYGSLRQQVAQLQEPTPPLLFGTILDPTRNVLAHTDPSSQRIGEPLALAVGNVEIFGEPAAAVKRYAEVDGKGVLLAGAPIVVADQLLATAWLAYDTGFLEQRLFDGAVRMALFAAAFAVAAGFVGWLISNRMVRPLRELMRAVGHLMVGDLSRVEPVQASAQDEIGRLARAFNQMTMELREKKKLEEQLRFQEKLAAIGRMVSGVAHEINNPLGGMKNAINTLAIFGHYKEKREEGVRLLSSGLKHIEGVVRALLVSHRQPLWDDACDPRVFDDLFLLVRADCEARGIQLRWENTLAGPVKAPCTALQQILMNLLSNAIYAMPDGGILTFSARDCEDSLVFTVRDTGRGIPSDQLEQVFEPFYTTRPDGVGLGLWVCLELVETIGGKLEVESRIGKGTTFGVRIPKLTTSRGQELVPGGFNQAGHN